jgi:hypothetical protein
MLKLDIRVEGIVHDRYPPNLHNGEIGRDTGNHVGQKYRDGIPFFHTKGRKTGRETIYHFLETLISYLIPLENKRVHFRKITRRPVKIIRHRYFLIINKFRNPLFIRLQPDFVLILDCICHKFPPSFRLKC